MHRSKIPAFTIFSLLLSPPAQAAWHALDAGKEPAPAVFSAPELAPDTVRLTLDLPGFDATDVETRGQRFTRVTVPGLSPTVQVGAPELPVAREFVEVPPGATVALRVVDARWRDLSLAGLDHPLPVRPVQSSVPKIPGARESAVLSLDESLYARPDAWPELPARLGETGAIRGHHFVEVELMPVRYLPAEHRLRVATHLEVELTVTGGDRDRALQEQARLSSPPFDAFAREHLLSPTPPDAAAVLPDLPVGYVIVTHDDFTAEAEELAEFKRVQGYTVSLATLGDLGVSDEPFGAQSAIQTYIADLYAGDVPPTYVLLMGDTRQIPSFQGSASHSATDLYYVTMDGDRDWLPDMYIGRLSAEEPEDMARMVDRTIRYSLFDLSSGTDWVQSATFMASTDNHHISEGTHDYCISTWLDPAGFESNKRYTSSNHAKTDEVIDDLNAGVSQLTYSGHGDTDSWSDGPALQARQVDSLENEEMWPVVQSYACLTGEYDQKCFAETWTRAENGAVAFYGSSTYSLWEEDDILQRRVYDAWFGDGFYSLDAALDEGMWRMYEHYSGSGNTQSYYEQFNLFGDPSLDIWTDGPFDLEAIHAGTVDGSTGALSVEVVDADGEPLADAWVSLYGGEGLQDSAYTGSDGTADLVLEGDEALPDTAQLYVSLHNYLPVWEDLTVGAVPDAGDTGSFDTGGSSSGGGLFARPGCGCASPSGLPASGRALIPCLLGLGLALRRRRP